MDKGILCRRTNQGRTFGTQPIRDQICDHSDSECHIWAKSGNRDHHNVGRTGGKSKLQRE